MSKEHSPEVQKLLDDLWAETRTKPRKPEACRATYNHYAHDDCPGVGSSREVYEAQDFDEVAYLEFYHEVYLFGQDWYRIEVGNWGIARIRADTNIITHDDGREEEIPWPCVREWSHVNTAE